MMKGIKEVTENIKQKRSFELKYFYPWKKWEKSRNCFITCWMTNYLNKKVSNFPFHDIG